MGINIRCTRQKTACRNRSLNWNRTKETDHPSIIVLIQFYFKLSEIRISSRRLQTAFLNLFIKQIVDILTVIACLWTSYASFFRVFTFFQSYYTASIFLKCPCIFKILPGIIFCQQESIKSSPQFLFIGCNSRMLSGNFGIKEYRILIAYLYRHNRRIFRKRKPSIPVYMRQIPDGILLLQLNQTFIEMAGRFTH